MIETRKVNIVMVAWLYGNTIFLIVCFDYIEIIELQRKNGSLKGSGLEVFQSFYSWM